MSPRPRPAVERFAAKVNETETCWLWTAGTSNRGYPVFDGNSAYRFSHETHIGPIPDGYEVDHLCRVPLCVNPDHLEAVTPAENRRRAKRARRPNPRGTRLGGYCAHGHEFTDENTYVIPSTGRRWCRECGRRRTNAYRMQLRAVSA